MTTRPASASRCIRRKRSVDSSSVSAEFGSSNRNTCASRASARPISVALLDRERHAPERHVGERRGWPGRRMSERSRGSRWRTSARVPSRPTIMFSATVRLGNSCGSWWTTATRSRSVAVSQVSPSSWISPSSAVVSPARILIIVLLPAPFGPATPRISPGFASRSSPSSARVSPYHLRRPTDAQAAGQRRSRVGRLEVRVGVAGARVVAHRRRFWVNRSSTTAAMVTAPETKLLQIRARGQQREAVGDDREQERAAQRPDGRPASTRQARAADDHGREDREQQPDAGVRLDRADEREVEHRRQRGQASSR